MSYLNYLTERPKLLQFGLILIVFFLLVSMTGEYHDLMIERDSFAKAVKKGHIEDSVGFVAVSYTHLTLPTIYSV